LILEFKRVIGNRRSIRYYQPWRPVEREKIQTMLEAARLASRAVNASFFKAIVVYRDQLSEAERDTLKLATTTAQLDLAPVWIFWYGDMKCIENTNKGATLKQLIDAGALNPSHGWSYQFVENVVYAQLLGPLSENREALLPLVVEEASLAMCQALLCAVDEGLGTQLTGFNAEAAKKILDIPDHLFPLVIQLVGYSAESPEAGGQRPREPFEVDFFEMKYGKPFKREPEVVKRLEDAGMIQGPAPLPWRKEEVRALSRMFGLPE
jgi:nitroreductase